MSTHAEARAALAAWEAAHPTNFFDADVYLQRTLRRYLGETRFERERGGLSAFGAEAAGAIDRLARETNRDENLPVLRRWDGIGRRTEEVVFHPGYAEIGRLVYRTGVISRYATPGDETVQLAYGYLLAHNGEAGHLCPVACTAGLVKLLQARADDTLKARLLPGLLHRDRPDPAHLHAAQFLTEIQGGSDVGSNACVARRDGDAWRISGEKWFCSVIDADLYLVTARPEGAPAGTRGLGAFVVPRLLTDGAANGVHIRRLKIKLGTRSMASGEADFIDALAWPVGPVDRGFKSVVEIVLNTSRIYNAVAAAGSMRRAEIEASTFATFREAFGRPIGAFPLVKRSLQRITTEARAATAGTFHLAAIGDRIARGDGDDADRAVFRLVVNMNKYWTAIRNTAVIREGIEVFGGNGTIEDFSVLPRLYRDAIVVESWEGTHNVLCAQVLRDLSRFELHTPCFAHLDRILAGCTAPALVEAREAVEARLGRDRARVDALLARDASDAQIAARDTIDQLMVTWQAASLLDVAMQTPAGADDVELLLGEHPDKTP